MYELDVTILVLGSVSSSRTSEILRLNDLATNAGFYTKISTNPTDLIRFVGRRFNIIVIDGVGCSDFNVYEITSYFQSVDSVAIVLLVGSDPSEKIRGLHAGADICLPAPINPYQFCASLHAIASRKVGFPDMPVSFLSAK
jgi:DNA-binding response OmpR family regulator